MSLITLRSIGVLGTVSIWRHLFRHPVTQIRTLMRAIPQRHSTLMWALEPGTTMARLEQARLGHLPTRVNRAVMTWLPLRSRTLTGTPYSRLAAPWTAATSKRTTTITKLFWRLHGCECNRPLCGHHLVILPGL